MSKVTKLVVDSVIKSSLNFGLQYFKLILNTIEASAKNKHIELSHIMDYAFLKG